MKGKLYPNLCHDENTCCGCTVCSDVCPVDAISFKYNNEGFLYPNVNYDKCIGCFKCEKICAYKKDLSEGIVCDKNEVYALKNTNKDVIEKSSSGGLFSALSDLYIENGDFIASCIYNKHKHAVNFEIYNDKIKRDLARGSKYIQAEIGTGYKTLLEWMNKNPEKKILIVGTGCQIAGLDKLLKDVNKRDRACLVDLVCHGAPSSLLWKKYASYLEKKYMSNIDEVYFKDKTNGWENPSTFVIMNGKKISIKPYADWFYGEWSIRKSCYNCPYTQINRNSDITIGDFWGINNVMPDFYDKMGVSLAIIHTELGNDVFSSIKSKIEYRKSNKTDCLQPRLVSSAKEPKDRQQFWDDLCTKGFEYCEKHYREEQPSVFHMIKLKVKRKIKMTIKGLK